MVVFICNLIIILIALIGEGSRQNDEEDKDVTKLNGIVMYT